MQMSAMYEFAESAEYSGKAIVSLAKGTWKQRTSVFFSFCLLRVCHVQIGLSPRHMCFLSLRPQRDEEVGADSLRCRIGRRIWIR